MDAWVVEVLRVGYRIPFDRRPPLSERPLSLPAYSPQSIKGVTLTQELQTLLRKGPVEPAPQSPGFYSRLFLVQKASGSWRPIIDLSTLNDYVTSSHFHMETPQSVLRSIRPGDWMSPGTCRTPTCRFLFVTSPWHESRLLWIHDPHRSQSSRVPSSHPPASQKNSSVPRINDTVPRTNYTVPRNNYQPPRNRENAPRNSPVVQSSDARMRAPLENIPSSVWHNSALSSRANDCPPVPRNNVTDKQINNQKTVPPPPKRKRNRVHRRERRARERAEREEAFIHDAQWATQSSGAPSSTLVPD